MGCVDHQPSRLARLARQFGKNLVEHAKTAPAHEPVVDRLARTVRARSIAPTQPIPDDEDDPANHPAIINSRNAMRQRGKTARSDASAPRTAGKNQSWRRLLAPPLNQPII